MKMALRQISTREVSVARAILKNARTKILVCDSLKFERTAPVRFDIGDIDYFVTDNEPSKRFSAWLKLNQRESSQQLAQPIFWRRAVYERP